MARPQRSDAWSGMGVGWAITSTLIAGMLVMGALGYLVDALFGTEHVFTGIGFVLGAALGVYAVYLRYGRGSDDAEG
ncbi:MAG TPA: AtpZ/AtpI family protein [Actinomycetota bacterium]|nr:AtpZ/AtpI family protein [Actinomycetota bacterium]